LQQQVFDYDVSSSVGIDLKELGGQLPKCLKFCPASVEGKHELGGWTPPPPTIPTLFSSCSLVHYTDKLSDDCSNVTLYDWLRLWCMRATAN